MLRRRAAFAAALPLLPAAFALIIAALSPHCAMTTTTAGTGTFVVSRAQGTHTPPEFDIVSPT